MTYGQIVAERFKKQYFRQKTGWERYDAWQIQPKEIFTILIELKSKSAIESLLGYSWTRKLPAQKTKQGVKPKRIRSARAGGAG